MIYDFIFSNKKKKKKISEKKKKKIKTKLNEKKLILKHGLAWLAVLMSKKSFFPFFF